MAKAKHAAENLPGVPLALFRAAVEAIADFRDSGKALVFLRGNGQVRIFGLSPSAAEFSERLSERLQGEALSTPQIQDTLAEIEEAISALLRTEGNEEAATKNLLYVNVKEFGHSSKFDPENLVHENIFNKVKAAVKLATDALKHRRLRLQSATIPCLEELDAELVRERQDRSAGKRVDVPFLRLRLRYGERITSLSYLMYPPFAITAKAFEVECDLSDLDLLQQRLDEARQMLLAASTGKEVGDDKK
jgi:hypothetical protein